LRIILDELQKKKIVRKSYLGARFVDSSDEKAQFFKNPLPAGLYIAQVFPHTICAHLGVRAGDMLYEFNGFALDEYGETKAPWSRDKVSLFDLVSRTTIGDEINMVLYRNGERIEMSGVMEEINPFAVRIKFPDYEEVSYDTIAGLVVMELAENHIIELLQDSPELIRFRQIENRINSVLVITHIVPGSYAYQMQALDVGTVIIAVNGDQVTTLDEWKKALEKSIKSGFVAITTEHDVVTIFSLEKILQEEETLHKTFSYPLSETVKNLQHMVRK